MRSRRALRRNVPNMGILQRSPLYNHAFFPPSAHHARHPDYPPRKPFCRRCRRLPCRRLDTRPVRPVPYRSDALFWSSPTAAETAAPHLSGSLKTTVPNIAVGAQTAAALQRTGFTNIHHSETGSDSEAAFSLPVWHTLPQHARVLIVRGTGGRAWLGGQLAARGFTVEYAEIYLREPQELDWARFQAAAPEAAWAASSEAVRAIFARCPPPLRQKLKSLLYFARHARIAETLSQSGAQRVRTADGIGSALNAFSPDGETQNV